MLSCVEVWVSAALAGVLVGGEGAVVGLRGSIKAGPGRGLLATRSKLVDVDARIITPEGAEMLAVPT